MAVIESMMVLYAKEVVTADRVLAAVQRFNFSGSAPMSETGIIIPPQDHEQGLLLWVSHACSALRKRVGQEIEQSTGAEVRIPNLHRGMWNLCVGGFNRKAGDILNSLTEFSILFAVHLLTVICRNHSIICHQLVHL